MDDADVRTKMAPDSVICGSCEARFSIDEFSKFEHHKQTACCLYEQKAGKFSANGVHNNA